MGRTGPHVTVVGLGPAGSDYVGEGAMALLTGAERTFLRTARHPAAAGFPGCESFDHLYESADTFEEVYRQVVERLVEAATAQEPVPVVYAVPGSPLIAERTVELLRADPRVDVTIVPSLSFLDLAWDRLGIDPLSAGVRLVDAGQLPGLVIGEGPYLVAQCWSQALLSDIKLSLHLPEGAAPPEVVLLHHLGLADEQVVRVGWWDLDRTLTPDHLTCLYIPAQVGPARVESEMARLEELVHTLRTQCPWDRAQTHATLMPHLVEESYEVLDALQAIDAADLAVDVSPARHLQEELGDLLFQIVFHARLAEEEGLFTLADVARSVHEKLVHRHPHVFGDVDADTADQVVANWEAIKKEEKGRASVTEGIPSHLPALLLSTKLQRKAASVGLPHPAPLPDTGPLVRQLAEVDGGNSDFGETTADAVLRSDGGASGRAVGELLFAVADVARRLGVDPEQALRARALELRDAIVAREADARREDPAPST